jgi:hypothetical protein
VDLRDGHRLGDDRAGAGAAAIVDRRQSRVDSRKATTDLREHTEFELQRFGYWPPWLEQDVDRGRRPDVVAVVVRPSPGGTEDLPLCTSPNLASKPVTRVAHCTTVVVRKVGGTPDERWYFVETPEGERGWVSDKFTVADICIG